MKKSLQYRQGWNDFRPGSKGREAVRQNQVGGPNEIVRKAAVIDKTGTAMIKQTSKGETSQEGELKVEQRVIRTISMVAGQMNQ